ncbi:MAG: protein translocase subunit SecF, partial [Myxococcota bacterium]
MFRLFDPKTPVDFVGKLPLGTRISVGVVAVSLVALMPFVRGINWGIDFAGGTEMQVKFSQAVDSEAIRQVLDGAGFDKKQVQRYGTEDMNEMLIRVERLTTLKSTDVEKLKALLEANLGSLAPGASGDVSVSFSEGEGDRVTITLPLAATAVPATSGADAGLDAPSPAEESALAQATKVDEQRAALAQLIEGQSGYKLRRTKAADQAEATTQDAIIADDPYQGRVKYMVYFQGISSEIEKALAARFGEVEVRRVEFVDSKVAEQLRTDGLLAVLLAILCILVYVAVRFDIYFAPGAVVALIHDAIIALVIFPLTWREFDLPSIAAVLTVVGYSINDTIVLYDRVREVVPAEKRDLLTEGELKGFINQAINDTFSRTINTALTTLIATLALALFARGAVENFALVLSVGIVVGTWSSIFVAPAVYLFLRRHFHSPEAV